MRPRPKSPRSYGRSSPAPDPAPPHRSAGPGHYDEAAATYDALNEANSAPTNRLLEEILRGHGAAQVLDAACGTGSQVCWLAARGFAVVGADISAAMLTIARARVARAGLDARLLQGDMRRLRPGGAFDAVLCIFNAVGHLTRPDFARAIRTAAANLRPGGLYLFDIFNLDHLLAGDNIAGLAIDWRRPTPDGGRVRKRQHSTIRPDGVLHSHTLLRQRGPGPRAPVRERRSTQTLQVYSAEQLREMLRDGGLAVERQCDADDGSPLDGAATRRILTVARAGG